MRAGTQLLLSTAILVFALASQGQTQAEENILSPIEVLGQQSELLQNPSEPQRISSKKLDSLQTTDVGRALKQVSGTYVRDEDGMGLRPNIGLRGTNPDRSKKVVILEDGVLIGPAPYSAPAAYYTPSLLMTNSLEIYKGFSALPYGPNSVGGAINYITPPAPSETQHEAKILAGSFQSYLTKLSTGGSLGQTRYYIEAARFQTKGFKKLLDNQNTGFDQNQFLAKWEVPLPHPEGLLHEIKFHFGYGDERSHETYLGVSAYDFYADPYRRYSASEKDLMKWTHQTFRIQHQYQLSSSVMVQSTLYQNNFHRSWYRLDGFVDTSAPLLNVLRDPDSYSNYADILRGTQDSSTLGTNGNLIVVNNDRTFLSQGFHNRWFTSLAHDGWGQDIDFSLRLHQDKIRRHHTSDRYEMLSGRLQRTTDATRTDTVNEDNAQAWTGTLMDNIRVGNWTFTPALRYEKVRFRQNDDLTANKKERTDDVWIPGMSFMNKLTPDFAAKYSINRGATLAGLSSTDLKREEAILHELDFTFVSPTLEAQGQLTFFYNDYQNITGTCTVSAGCSGAQIDREFSGGKAKIYGTELRAARNFWYEKYQFPITWTMTYLKAQLDNDFQSTLPEWGVGPVRKGDPLPYVPEWQSMLSLGLQSGRFFHELMFSYQGPVYDQSAEVGRQTIPAYGVVDWAASYNYSKEGKIIAKVDNLLAREYIASSRPYGLRPGKAQSFQLGLQTSF